MPDNLLLVDHRQCADARARSPRCFHPITALTRRGDQTVEAAGHRRPATAGAFRQLRQVVVGVAGATRRIATGSRITVDGTAGTIIIESQEEEGSGT